ncbi:glycosyltransferase family 2 protein [Pontivivens insulae]|uniref:Glycosyltransferase 2-like domain-containing protein n=1 Tax=Pontivivens insulae TaxID=1639689 RepID=A0A2R8AE18_9RHOB|nr:glycosyltransferase family 2 protein [Pontivivens insulae]RED14410.1 glycosyltransferase involved in cell wall biosynthesis [Pontivivens insulae]SPF30487.1 hypothetical protein POI8812_02825 [Pontivivens insulae]
MTRLPLSIFIITKNEEARLPRTLAAIEGWVDDLVIVDSGSTDRTLEIARDAGARVLHRDWTGFGEQKRHGEEACRNRWVLNLDADDLVTPELREEISALFAEGAPEPASYKTRQYLVYPGDEAPRGQVLDYNVIRLYHLDAARFSDHPLFDRVHAEPGTNVHQLNAPMWHFSILTYGDFAEKVVRSAAFQAEAAKRKPRWQLLIRLWLEFPLQVLKIWLTRGHWRAGWRGFAVAVIAAFGRWLRVLRLLERG